MAKKKWKQLKADGCYGMNISAYSEHTASCKEQFLRDAKALLREVAGHLASRHGLTESEINVNPGGMAGSGDVYAHFWNPQLQDEMLYCSIGASFVGHGRQDRLMILARKEERIIEKSRRGWRTGQMGANQWIDPGQNSLQLTATLLKIMGIAQAANHLTGVSYHSQNSGLVPFPGPVVASDCDSVQWFLGYATLKQTMKGDALNHREADQAIAIQMTLPV